jgi:hypothetical protein
MLNCRLVCSLGVVGVTLLEDKVRWDAFKPDIKVSCAPFAITGPATLTMGLSLSGFAYASNCNTVTYGWLEYVYV